MYSESMDNIKDKIKKKDAKLSFRKNIIREKYKVLLIQIDKEKSLYIIAKLEI